MKKPLILINDFKGGMTLNDKMGRPDQFAIGKQLDFSSNIGYLSPGIAFVGVHKDGGGAFEATEFTHILQTIKDGNGWFLGENTKIYYLDGDGEIKEAADSDQTGVFKGAAEYKSYLLYLQNTTLGVKDLSQAYNAGFTHNFKTGFASADYHPIKISEDKAYIGNGRYVASITDPTDNNTVTLQALDLDVNWQVRCLENFGHRYLAIGANYFTSTYKSSECKIFLWNKSDASWNDEIIIPENEIKAMKFVSGYLWIWAGESSNLYVIPENSRKATKIWSFMREDQTAEFEVYPGAVIARRGTIYFSLSGGDSFSAARNQVTGIFSFPANPNKFSLNRFYGVVNAALDIKGIGIVNNKVYFSTEHSSLKRAYRENAGASEYHYQDSVRYDSFRFSAPENKDMFTETFGITFDPLPAGCSLILYYRADDESTKTVISSFSTADTVKKIVRKGIITHSLQLLLELVGSSADSNYTYRPFIKSIFVTGSLIPRKF